MRTEIAAFADYVALAYHEARNVRHLVSAGYLDRAPYRFLIDGMPTKREEAWRKLKPLRREASSANSAQEAEAVFQQKFELSLEELVAISENLHWSGTHKGGNRWAQIDRKIIELKHAIDQNDKERTTILLQELPRMSHNTGRLGKKLELLNR